MLPSTGDPQDGVDEALLETWNTSLEAPTVLGNVLSAIHTTLSELAEELNWGVEDPALQIWSKLLTGNEVP